MGDVPPPRDGIFECRTVPDRDRAWVVPKGEIDIATAREVEESLAELQDAGFACVALDLRGVTFLDLTGLRVIERARVRADARASRFELVGEPAPVARLVELAGDAVRQASRRNGHGR
jgi:anti-sigma B factor antagonist